MKVYLVYVRDLIYFKRIRSIGGALPFPLGDTSSQLDNHQLYSSWHHVLLLLSILSLTVYRHQLVYLTFVLFFRNKQARCLFTSDP